MSEQQPVADAPQQKKSGLLGVIKKIPPISSFLRAHKLGRDLALGKGGWLPGIGKTLAGFAGGAVTAFFGLQVGALGALLLAATPGVAQGLPILGVATFAAGLCCATAGTWVCSLSSGLFLQSADNIGSGVRNIGEGIKKVVTPAKKLPAPANDDQKPVLSVVPAVAPANDDAKVTPKADFSAVSTRHPARKAQTASELHAVAKKRIVGFFNDD